MNYFIKDEQINPELLRKGKMVRRLLPYFKESTFRKINWILDKTMKGKCFSNKINYSSKNIKREDGSPLRIIVCTPKERKGEKAGFL